MLMRGLSAVTDKVSPNAALRFAGALSPLEDDSFSPFLPCPDRELSFADEDAEDDEDALAADVLDDDTDSVP